MSAILLALALFLAGTGGGEPTPPPTPAPVGSPGSDSPPADIKSDKLVRCLVDSPDGCTGCDQGDTCVYKQMKEYDCVYIVYGTKCD